MHKVRKQATPKPRSGEGGRDGARAWLGLAAAVIAFWSGGSALAQGEPQAPARTAVATPGARPAAAPPAKATAASPAARAPRPGEVETVPIKCWWKSDTTAVRIGERFTVTLTCGVIETAGTKVVPGINQLDPGAVQLTPFEVVSGTRREDIVTPPWRYFQFEYRVRLLTEGFFGQDVSIPPLPITYSVQSTAGSGARGRDQSYILPAIPVRVATLVPKDAADIRDAPPEGFAPIEARRYRATTATVAAGVLFAFAGVLLAVAALRALGRVRKRRPMAARPVAPLAVLNACLRGLAQIKAEVMRESWSPELARRALPLLRLAAAIGLGRPIAQVLVAPGAHAREGQLVVRQGLLRPRRSMVSAATTAQSLEQALSAGHPDAAGARAALEQIRAALHVFSTGAYGRNSEADTIALDSALASSTDAIRQLRRRTVWPMNGFRAAPAAGARVGVGSLSEERL